MKNSLENVKSSIPQEVATFNKEPLNAPNREKILDENVKLIAVQVEDYKWRVNNRGRFGWAIFGLLVVQNFFVFGFISVAFFYSCLNDLQWLFSAFFIGLMTQTYLTANYLVKWLFSEINYQIHKF